MADLLPRLEQALGSRYRIARELGEGGMATVFLAEDLKHERQVALKVLKPELAAVVGAERFLAEIRTTANLQHPHILPLFDSGEADGLLYYVMPFVDGESLADRLERDGQLPVDEAVRIAVDVAGALQAAHDQGVIHRDIKPANILMSGGRPMIADFGIGLAVSTAGEGRLTETGLSLGTPWYMSPEQASADRDANASSDVYSLGCVLYEMLVGEPPFVGKTAQAVLARILTGEVTPPRAARTSIPQNVDAAIRTAIERTPADRFQRADDFARALRDPAFRAASDGSATGADTSPWRRVGPVAVGLAAIATVAAVLGWLRTEPAPVFSQWELAMPSWVEDPSTGYSTLFDVAADGSWIAGSWPVTGAEGSGIWIQERGRLDWTLVSGTERGLGPRASPDGERIAFVRVGEGPTPEIRVIDRAGGSSTSVMTGQVGLFDWLDETSLVVVGLEGGRPNLTRVDVATGETRVLFASDSIIPLGVPAAYAGGRGVLVNLCRTDAECIGSPIIHAVDVASGEFRPVTPGTYAAPVEDETRLVILDASGRVSVAPFDPARGMLTDDPVPILDGIATPPAGGYLPLSAEGMALGVLGPSNVMDSAEVNLMEPVWIARDGTVAAATDGWRVRRAGNQGIALSADARRLAASVQGDEGSDVWIKELPDGPLSRVSLHPANDARPAWGPGDEYVWFESSRDGGRTLYRRRADLAAPAEYVPTPGRDVQSIEPTPDGEWVVVRTGGAANAGGGRDVAAFRTSGDSTELPLLVEDYDEYLPRLSPDGRFLAYVSDESGTGQVYVRPFPDVSARRWQVSTSGGTRPLWKGDGTELYYQAPGGVLPTMWAASIDTSDGFEVIAREELFEIPNGISLGNDWEPTVDVDPDGSRFIALRLVLAGIPDEDDQTRRLVLFENLTAAGR